MIVIDDVRKSFATPQGLFHALKGVSLTIAAGEMVAITGKSGSGKSTLLNLLCGIDRPTTGSVSIAGTRLDSFNESRLAEWRGRHIGVVFQFFQLIPTLTVAENVMLPMELCRMFAKEARRPRALELLSLVGIVEQADKLPATLSGGQQQRAAIARALANDPPLIVADEPTGNLDSVTTAAILELFAGLTDAAKTVVIVTHEREFTKYFQRVLAISDGRIVSRGEHVDQA